MMPGTRLPRYGLALVICAPAGRDGEGRADVLRATVYPCGPRVTP